MPFLTRYQTAEFLNVSMRTIDTMLRDGRLKYVKLGRSIRIPTAQLTALSTAKSNVVLVGK